MISVTPGELRRLYAILLKAGWSDWDLEQRMSDKYGVDFPEELTYEQYNELCTFIEANKKGDAS